MYLKKNFFYFIFYLELRNNLFFLDFYNDKSYLTENILSIKLGYKERALRHAISYISDVKYFSLSNLNYPRVSFYENKSLILHELLYI